MTREELYKRLDELNGSPARAAELEGRSGARSAPSARSS